MLQLRSSRPGDRTRIVRSSTITLFILLILSASTLQAATATLTWDPNAEPDIAGYVLSYGTSSGNYSTSVDVGKVTTWSVSLSPGFQYYFAVQAYNTSGVRSAFSAEVSKNLLTNAPTIASLSPASGNVGTSVTISGANFGTTQGSSAVQFNGTVATPTSWSANTIVAPVPAGATSGSVVVTVGGVASNGVTFSVTSSGLPAPWSSQDVGNPSLAGQASYGSGTFSVSGAGTDIWYSSDQFRFVYQPLNGDGQIVARVASLQSVDQWTKVGVMIRQDLAGDAPNAMAEVTAANGMVFQSRVTRGGASTSIKGFAGVAPQWVRVVRSGNTFSGYVSANGTTWTLIGTSTVTMPAQAYVGLAVTSHNPSATAAATFTDVTVSGGSVPSNRAPTLTQPANQASAEGSSASVQLAASDPDGNALTYSATGLPASLSVNPTSGLISGTLTFTSAGTYSVTATVSDGSLSTSQTFTWTVSDVSPGLSITNLSPTSGAVGTSVTINGVNFGATQGSSTVRFNGTVATPTSWSANTIVAPVPAGATSGSVVVTVGGVASNGVTFSVTSSGLPAPWSSQDVGNPSLAGQASYGSGTFSVSGAGTDIWYSSDQFRFVYQPLNGDGQIVARVASLQSVDQWTKVGVMIRQDLAGDAPNAMAEVTAANGMVFQSRVTRGGASTSIKGFAGVAPQWVRVVRSGNTFSGYFSANGTTWTLIGTSTVTMPAQAYVGLAVTSHNPSATAAATFTDVTVSGGSVPSNSAPTLTQPANQTSAEGSSPSVQLAASDPDGNSLTYSATGLPASLSVNPASGLISGTLTLTSAGTYSVTATVSDGSLSNSKTFTWTVSDVSQGPSITNLSPTSGAVGTSVTINGANFGTTQGSSTVRFNGTVATPTSWSANTIVAAVPASATTGPVTVTVNGTASNTVTFTVSSSGLPAPWLSQDVGNPAVAGQENYSSGTFTIYGAGVDIWGNSDQFRYVYQTLDGDGQIVAQVTDVQKQDPRSKAGVMIREDLTGNAPHATAVVTPADGTLFEWRTVRGGTSTSMKAPAAAAPRWVRIVRSGNSFSGYHSADGVTWTLLGTATVTMASRVYIGLAVTSRDPAVTGRGIFSNVAVATGSATAQMSTSSTASTVPLLNPAVAGANPEATNTDLLTPPTRPSPSDYDGDGKADLAVFRPSTGEWQIRTSSAQLPATPVVWGTLTDVPVPGDYDGDRKTDMAFYRPSLGLWSIRESSATDPAPRDLFFIGAQGAVPVPGDYDGDGKTDPAFYSPATGSWTVLKSTSGFLTEAIVALGSMSDIAAPGDYDGDGKTDPAVFRAATGQWIMRLSSVDYATTVTLDLGTPTDIPVPGDYDGDGVTDIAVFQPATSTWVARLSSLGLKATTLATLGAAGDTPVAADYDGDGKADLAVFHDGLWQILASSLNYSSGIVLSWGQRADVPLH